MIDTVKLAIPYSERPKWLTPLNKKSKLDAGKGTFTTNIFPSTSYKKTEIYLPKLQFVESPSYTEGVGRLCTLYVEVSLPKLFFGNNFDELTDELFMAVANKLSALIWTIYDIKLSPTDIAQASVARVDYSKNIVFTNRTPVSSVISVVAKGNIPKTYDVQKTDFRNGGMIYHIHANIIDIVFYDKVADLAQAKTSERRSHEKHNYTQLKLVDEFEKNPNVSVFRYEIRLNGMEKIRKELVAIGESDELRFSHVFSSDISRRILLNHWEKITSEIPKTESLAQTPSQMLTSHAITKQGMKFAEASAYTLMRILRNEIQEERAVRHLIESLFGRAQYSRLKKVGREPLTDSQVSSLLHFTNTITEMHPISIAEFIQIL